MLQSRETSAQPRVESSFHQNHEGGTHQNGDFCCPGIHSHTQTSHQSRESSLQPSNNGMKRGSQQSREATHPSRGNSREPSTKTSLERGSRSREIVNHFLPAKNFTEEPRASCSKSRASSRQGDIGPQLLSQPPPLSLGVPAKYPSLFHHPHSAAGQLAPTTPSVTPPSPSSALPHARNPLLRQKTLPSPSSMSSSATRPTSSSSLSPSPVPSLEWVSQGEPILTIPDTCPAIRALLTHTPDLDLSSPELWRTWPPSAPLPRASVLPNNSERRSANSTSLSSRKSSPQKNSPSLEKQPLRSVPLSVERRLSAARASLEDTLMEGQASPNSDIRSINQEQEVLTPERKITLATKTQLSCPSMDPLALPPSIFRPASSPLAVHTGSSSASKACPVSSTSKPLATPLPSTPPRPVASVTPE